MSTVDQLAQLAMEAAKALPDTFRESPEGQSLHLHTVVDALHRIADLHARGRVEYVGGTLTRVRATDVDSADLLIAAMDAPHERDGAVVGWILNGVWSVTVEPEPPFDPAAEADRPLAELLDGAPC